MRIYCAYRNVGNNRLSRGSGLPARPGERRAFLDQPSNHSLLSYGPNTRTFPLPTPVSLIVLEHSGQLMANAYIICASHWNHILPFSSLLPACAGRTFLSNSSPSPPRGCDDLSFVSRDSLLTSSSSRVKLSFRLGPLQSFPRTFMPFGRYAGVGALRRSKALTQAYVSTVSPFHLQYSIVS
jgi:hypothetical protein